MGLRRVVYGSYARKNFSEEELDTLLVKARARNTARDITGLLLHADGNFLQVIEGPAEKIEALLERIHNDPRHGGLMVILDEDIAARDFGEWSMAFRRVNGWKDSIPGFSAILHSEQVSGETMADLSLKVDALIRGFRRGTNTL